jgi:hypothetical protein
MAVGAFLNASIKSGAGFGTLIMAVATFMQTAPLCNFGARSNLVFKNPFRACQCRHTASRIQTPNPEPVS